RIGISNGEIGWEGLLKERKVACHHSVGRHTIRNHISQPREELLVLCRQLNCLGNVPLQARKLSSLGANGYQPRQPVSPVLWRAGLVQLIFERLDRVVDTS